MHLGIAVPTTYATEIKETYFEICIQGLTVLRLFPKMFNAQNTHVIATGHLLDQLINTRS